MPLVRKTRPKKICKIRYFYKIFSNLFIFLRPVFGFIRLQDIERSDNVGKR